MPTLELKIPPPLVALLTAAAMGFAAGVSPTLGLPAPLRMVVAACAALVGGAFSVAGVVSFRKAKTTVNPMKPASASSLVTSGVYRITRNPMYLGLLLVLVAWAVYLSSAWALAGPVIFFLYITRFQIAPEERALSAMFGPAYLAYRSKVRRWL